MKKALILALILILPKIGRTSSNSENGVVLPVIIVLGFAVTVTGIAFLNSGVMENRLASREVDKNEAFYLAEAGLERTLWNLEQNFEVRNEDWADGAINGVVEGENGACNSSRTGRRTRAFCIGGGWVTKVM